MNYVLGNGVNILHTHKIDTFRCTVSELGHRSPQKVEISGGP